MPLTTEKIRPREHFSWGILAQLQYRLPMTVTTALEFGGGNIYPRCPRCQVSMEREYMAFCDRCGQRLEWSKWDEVEILEAGAGKVCP